MAEKQKILVVDDEPEIREVLQMMLSSEGYEITEACLLVFRSSVY